MNRFEHKIKYFKESYPERQFPTIRELGKEETRLIRHRLADHFVLSSVDPLAMVMEIDRRQEVLKEYNAEEKGFRLSPILSKLNVPIQKNVYLNWYRYDVVDEMAFTDLDTYFDDIWYPGPDDVDIFDSSFGWILSIQHEGYVMFLMAEKRAW